MPWRRVPDHRDPFTNLNGDRERLAQAFDGLGRPIPIEELFYELGYEYKPSPRFRDLDDIDSDDHHGRRPIRHRQDFRPVTYRHHRARENMDEKRSEAVSLGRAMKTLHRQVMKAEDCYTSFTEEFDIDVLSIKEYAGSELLKKLWKNKVTGRKVKDVDGDNGDDGAADFEKKFGEQKKSLLDAMKKAMNSYLKDSSSDEEAANEKRERASRLIQKLSMADSQVRILLEKVPAQQEACKELVAELQLLKKILDPEAEINKDLYNEDGRDNGESNRSGSSGSGTEGQGDNWS